MNRAPLPQGILFDLDGVLYVDKQPIAGASAALEQIRAAGVSCRFVTNTSTLSRQSLYEKIAALGFDIRQPEIISAPQAALLYLQNQPDAVCKLVLAEDVRQDFSALRQSDDHPSHIVIGDIGEAWSYLLLNELFRCLQQGAKLIAIHKNRYWQTADGLQLDIGAFITGLEYASGAATMIIGKPAADFFRIALDDLECTPAQTLMVGDDIDSDIGGAQQVGIPGVLVRTGKFRTAYTAASSVKPEWTIDSIAGLPCLLGL